MIDAIKMFITLICILLFIGWIRIMWTYVRDLIWPKHDWMREWTWRLFAGFGLITTWLGGLWVFWLMSSLIKTVKDHV